MNDEEHSMKSPFVSSYGRLEPFNNASVTELKHVVDRTLIIGSRGRTLNISPVGHSEYANNKEKEIVEKSAETIEDVYKSVGRTLSSPGVS